MHVYVCDYKCKVTHDTKFWGSEPSVKSPGNSTELLKKFFTRVSRIAEGVDMDSGGTWGRSPKCQLQAQY